MHRLLTLIGAVVMLVSFPSGSALTVGLGDTVTTQITATILPYAEVEFYTDTVQVTLPQGATTATCDPAVIGGSVICNCPVNLFGNITPPGNAPGTWGVALPTKRIDNPGEYVFADLFEITVLNDGTGGDFNDEAYGMAVSSSFASVPEEAVVVITAIPE